MHRTHFTLASLLFFLFCGSAFAGTIYTWTDADGVKRFSNSQPPEDAQNVQTIEEVETSGQDAGLQRQEYDRMVEEAGKEADRHFEEQAAKQAQREKAERQNQLEEQNKRVEEELTRLNAEIEGLKNRGLSTTYTTGMRDNQIGLIQEKIDLLKSDPDAYFKRF
jgi:hypothetical protein